MQGPSAWHIFVIESKLGLTFSTRLIRKLGRDYFRFRNFKQQTKRKCKRRKKGRKITFEDKTSENATNGAVGRERERREQKRERDKPHTTLSRLFSFHIFIWPSISPSLSLAFVPSSSIYHFFHSCSNKSHPFQSLSHSLTLSPLPLSSFLHLFILLHIFFQNQALKHLTIQSLRDLRRDRYYNLASCEPEHFLSFCHPRQNRLLLILDKIVNPNHGVKRL